MAAMFARESLWQRRAGAGWWVLAWTLAAACAVPWLVPEAWDGRLPVWSTAGGWLVVLASAPLAGSRRWAVLPLALTLAWGTVGALGRLARWEAALPGGLRRVEGILAAPWNTTAGGRSTRVRLTAPAPCAACGCPCGCPMEAPSRRRREARCGSWRS